MTIDSLDLRYKLLRWVGSKPMLTEDLNAAHDYILELEKRVEELEKGTK